MLLYLFLSHGLQFLPLPVLLGDFIISSGLSTPSTLGNTCSIVHAGETLKNKRPFLPLKECIARGGVGTRRMSAEHVRNMVQLNMDTEEPVDSSLGQSGPVRGRGGI